VIFQKYCQQQKLLIDCLLFNVPLENLSLI
jgi:hypothetical protein